MSQCLFIHDFFQDGRLDVLDEVRELQVCGQWTKEKRAAWTKQAKASYERAKSTHPRIPQGSSYYAGRIAGLRSTITARYPKLDPQLNGRMVFQSLTDEKKVICLECGDDATWKCLTSGSFHLSFSLCDRCKQERVRTQDSLTVFGWDHKKHELLPLPVEQEPVLLKKAARGISTIAFPATTVLSFDLSNSLWPVSHAVLFSQSLLIVLVTLLCTPLLRLLTDSEDDS